MSCSCTGASMSERSGSLSTLPVRLSWSAWSHGATEAVKSVASRLLLLAQLQQVLGLLDTPAPVLTRRIAAPLDRALLGQAALALQEQLHALAAAELALRSDGTSH